MIFGLVAGSEDRDKMQIPALAGMAKSHLLVQLDAEAGGRGRDDITILPLDRLLQDFAMEATPSLDAFQAQEIRAAGTDLDVGGTHHRPAVEMGRELGLV